MTKEEILQLSEEDVKLRYITPAILKKGWSVEDITMETKVKLTDGKINLKGNLYSRVKSKFADYVLVDQSIEQDFKPLNKTIHKVNYQQDLDGGISQLENQSVLRLDPFRKMGSPANNAKLFGGNEQYATAVKELETLIYTNIA